MQGMFSGYIPVCMLLLLYRAINNFTTIANQKHKIMIGSWEVIFPLKFSNEVYILIFQQQLA